MAPCTAALGLLCLVAIGHALVLQPTAPHVTTGGRIGRRCTVRAQQTDGTNGLSAAAWLEQGAVTPATREVLLAIFDGCKEISLKIATASCDSFACFNDFGAEQLAIDLLAEEVLFERLRSTGHVAVASSESDKVLRELHADGSLSVALDPIDADTIMDTNFAVGTIFGVWDAPSLINVTGRQLVAAGTCTYGPRTTLTVALSDRPAVYELVLVDGEWLVSNIFETMREKGKLFAPGNLRATADNAGYAALVRYWHDEQYQLRYTGGMVCDVSQLVIKGHGVFVNPSSPGQRPALRLLYEGLPMAFLVEKAGGASSDGAGSLLDLQVTAADARTQVALGSTEEVERFEQMVGPAAPRVKLSSEAVHT